MVGFSIGFTFISYVSCFIGRTFTSDTQGTLEGASHVKQATGKTENLFNGSTNVKNRNSKEPTSDLVGYGYRDKGQSDSGFDSSIIFLIFKVF